jgi:hypothetical protein
MKRDRERCGTFILMKKPMPFYQFYHDEAKK